MKTIIKYMAERSGREVVVSLIILICLILLSNSCIGQSTMKTGEPSQQPQPPTPVGTSKEPTVINLAPYPKGWVPGTEGWIPPLPPGLKEPRPLTKDEWSMVIAVAYTDPEVVKQTANNNINEMIHYWVGYAGGPGDYTCTDSDIISGKARPPEGRWYYPAIMFRYTTRTDGNGQLVAVDLATKKIVLSETWGIEPPKKPPITGK